MYMTTEHVSQLMHQQWDSIISLNSIIRIPIFYLLCFFCSCIPSREPQPLYLLCLLRPISILTLLLTALTVLKSTSQVFCRLSFSLSFIWLCLLMIRLERKTTAGKMSFSSPRYQGYILSIRLNTDGAQFDHKEKLMWVKFYLLQKSLVCFSIKRKSPLNYLEFFCTGYL